jgi:putative AbiEi antitoxin of type IV toxin-antitoxin system/uncharacterized protein DUF559
VGRKSEYFTRSSQTIDGAIAVIAAKQNGNITTEQLLGLGLDMSAISYRVRIGRLYRVYRGVYSVGRPPITPVERATAAVLACGRGAALSHGSAMTLWGFWRRWDEPFEVTVPGDRRPGGIVVHRSARLSWRDVRTHLGVRATSSARTVLDIAPRLDDTQLKRTVRDALHSRWLTESQLGELLARQRHRPGGRRVASLIGLPGTPPRAGWEDEFPAFCAAHGLPAPVMGAVVCGYVVDALFAAEKLIVELDSWEFHRDAIAFQTDRERDAVTLADGFGTLRITWERIKQAPGREAARLRRILAQRRAALSPSA